MSAKFILIAVGGRPSFLPNIPYADNLVITSDDLFSMKKPPGKTLIVGASYIALECAGLLAGFGFDVTVMVRSILLRGFDQEVANKIGEYMEKHKVKFIREAIPVKIEKTQDDKRIVHWAAKEGDQPIGNDTFDTVMLAIGRNADTKNLGLEKVGIQTKPNGKIICQDNDLTGCPSIFAIGDVVYGRLELTPAAIKAGRNLAARLFNKSNEITNYKFCPTTVFTPLEYGACGYSEEDAITT